MAYNHGREDRKWRIWKEAEEKLLRECGVDEATIEQIRISSSGSAIIVSSLSIAFLHLPYPCFVYLFHPHACLNLLGLRLDTH